MNRKFLKLGLTGWLLEHSLSPRLHTAALRAASLPGEYILYPIPPQPDVPAELMLLLDRMRTGELHGLNVTIPHKQTVLPLLDEITPTARAIGAVNTLFMHAGRLAGGNTDAPAFLGDLARIVGTGGNFPGRALVLGAGGAARAVVYALSRAGWEVWVAARRVAQAETLANDMAPAPIRALSMQQAWQVPECELLVNTTPLGMVPHADSSPWPLHAPLPCGTAVYDLVYNPAETCLLKQARLSGHPAANGLGMLIEQAALAFEYWSGGTAPRQAMRQAVASFL